MNKRVGGDSTGAALAGCIQLLQFFAGIAAAKGSDFVFIADKLIEKQ